MVARHEAAEDVSWGSGQGQRGGKQWRGQNAPEGDPAPRVSGGELPALQSWEKEKTGWGQGIKIPCGLFSSPPLPPAPADTLSCFLVWYPIRPRPDEKVTTRGLTGLCPGDQRASELRVKVSFSSPVPFSFKSSSPRRDCSQRGKFQGRYI